jgi:tetratricopeptide (TPR) repeat protein
MAYSLVQQGEYLTARQQLLKALQQRNDIQDRSTLNWLLNLLWWTWAFTEQYRESEDFFSTYLQKYPDDARAYRDALPHGEALEVLSGEAEKGWLDSSVVLEFLRACKDDACFAVRGRTMLASYYE